MNAAVAFLEALAAASFGIGGVSVIVLGFIGVRRRRAMHELDERRDRFLHDGENAERSARGLMPIPGPGRRRLG